MRSAVLGGTCRNANIPGQSHLRTGNDAGAKKEMNHGEHQARALKIWLKEPPEYAELFCRLILVRLSITQLTITFNTAIGATGKIKDLNTVSWDKASSDVMRDLLLESFSQNPPLAWCSP